MTIQRRHYNPHNEYSVNVAKKTMQQRGIKRYDSLSMMDA